MRCYGMRPRLVPYRVNHLFVQPEVGREVLGFDALKQALSSQVQGLCTGFVDLTPICGGLLADPLPGRRKAIIAGGALTAIGHVLLAAKACSSSR